MARGQFSLVRASVHWAGLRNFVPVLCAASALLSVSGAAEAQDAQPWQEYGKKVSTAQTVTALDGGSFGQAISLYDGSTVFAATDITIPGNNALPVALGRRYVVEDRFQMTYLGGFGNWDIDIPHIEGTFSSTHGWVVAPPNAPNRNSRCSVQQVPYIGNSSFEAEDIWSGYRVHVPGMDGEEMLKAIPGAYGAPADGQTYPWTTASQGRLKCLPTLQGGYAGEGFELITPDGLRYRFDKIVERTIRSIKKPVMGALTRKRMYMLASRIEDRYGNWVNYSYSGDKLQSISSSDGRNITLTWSGDKVSSAATNGRTWTYQYAQDGALSAVVNPDSSRWGYSATGVLKAEYIEQLGAGTGPTFCAEPGLGQGHYEFTVTHPAGAQAKFSFEVMRHYRVGVHFSCVREIPENTVWVFQSPSGSQTLSSSELRDVLQLMLPEDKGGEGLSGSEAIARVKPEALVTHEDPLHFEVLELPGYDRLRWTNYFDSFSLTGTEVSGSGLQTQLTQYSYETPTSQGFCYDHVPCDFSGAPMSNSLPDSKWVTVTKADGSKDRHRFGIIYGANEGRLLETTTGNATTVLRTQATTFVQDSEVAGFGFPDKIGQSLRSEVQLGRVRPVRLQVANQDGAAFSFAVDAFDAHARPVAVTRASSLGYSRQETTVYHDDAARWVLGQVAKVTCTLPSAPLPQGCGANGVVMEETTFDGWARPATQAKFGSLVSATTYNSDGTLATIKDGNNNITAMSNWKRGTPQTIQHPGTPEASTGAARLVEVDNNGWIVSVTDELGAKTCYGYDAMGRVNLISHPSEEPGSSACDNSAWEVTTIEFRPMTAGEWRPPGVAAGQWRQYTSTGSHQELVYLDALWRPTLTHEYDSTNTTNTLRAVSTAYDVAGRVAFQSYPSSDIVPSATGTWTFYDALDRVKEVRQDSEQGQLTTATEYLASKVRVIDPSNEQTLTTFMALDEPTYELPVRVDEPLGRTTLIPRDIFGKPIQIERQQ